MAPAIRLEGLLRSGLLAEFCFVELGACQDQLKTELGLRPAEAGEQLVE